MQQLTGHRLAGASIYLPALERAVSVRAYVAAVKRAKAEPSTTFRAGLETWWPTAGLEVRGQFNRALHARINSRIPGYDVGRKWQPQWQADAMRAAHDVNTPRLAIRWLPSDLRARFAHRLSRE